VTYRTIVIGSRIFGPPDLVWPIKQPDAELDYSLDVTADLGTDTIVAASISQAPSGTTETSIISLVVVGMVITAIISGGKAGRIYTTKIIAQTTAGLTHEWIVNLPISSATFISYTSPSSFDFGTPVTWGTLIVSNLVIEGGGDMEIEGATGSLVQE
jgi:hypothetical protein